MINIRNIISAYVKTNGTGAITGGGLNNILQSILSAIGLSQSTQTGHVSLNDGQPMATSGEAESLAGQRQYAGNPFITSIHYTFNGTNGIGNGYIEQNIYRYSNAGGVSYECMQILRLNYRKFKRIISLSDAPAADGIFNVTLVGAWSQIS